MFEPLKRLSILGEGEARLGSACLGRGRKTVRVRQVYSNLVVPRVLCFVTTGRIIEGRRARRTSQRRGFRWRPIKRTISSNLIPIRFVALVELRI
jgi:hypothetical protein